MGLYRDIWNRLESAEALVCEKVIHPGGGAVSDLQVSLKEKKDASDLGVRALEAGIPIVVKGGEEREEGREGSVDGSAAVAAAVEKEWLVAEPFFPKERLIILGGGHVALPVAEFGARCGFLVTVVDDRLSFANKGRFPMAERVLCDDFVHAIEELKIRESDYVCILTRGHRWDTDCLRAIGAGTEPAYLGMIGSRRRTAIVKQNLLEEGYDEARMARLHTPIGLAIGGVTPEEIAISIMAEIISVKRLCGPDKRVINRSDVDFEVMRALAEETDEPKAVVTVIESRGSSPRGAGAKMIVYRDGRILGSIGGGCGEAAVLGEARRIIGSEQYKVIHVDLTGDAAEEEGMVCGGVMDVLVEDCR